MLASVPKPGLCLSGIHKARTANETKKVDSPILNGVLSEIPSDKTTHGEFPNPVTTRNASPMPKIVKPKIRIASLCM
jgi:hypothetical protein